MQLRRRLITATTALALAAPALAATSTTPAAHAATPTYTVAAGMLSPWVQDSSGHYIQNFVADGHEVSSSYVPGFASTFFPWTASPSGIVNWATYVRQHGAVPEADLYPPSGVTLSQIAAGSQDSYLQALAQALKAWNHPFMFRLFPEMTGNWESYSPGTHGQTSAQFVAAWRHVWTVFRNIGTPGVQFVWNPNRLDGPQTAAVYKADWPGLSYVNWIGLDGYAWQDSSHGYTTPYSTFKSSVTAIRSVAGSKPPLMIAEVGVQGYNGKMSSPFQDKAHWLQYYMSQLTATGAKIINYFNISLKGQPNWRYDSTSPAGPNVSSQLAGARAAVTASNVAFAGRTPLSVLDHLAWAGTF